MKIFAAKDKRSSPVVSRSHHYVHHPMGPVQLAQRAEIRRILRSTGAQAKLTIGQPNDKYEQEADRVADQVMAMPDPKLQRQPENEEDEETLQTKPLADQITPLVQRQEDPPEEEEEPVQATAMPGQTLDIQRIYPECEEGQSLQRQTEEEDEEIQAKEQPGYIPQVPPNVAANIQSKKGGGQPLANSTRSFFESRFDQDFSQVRIHTGAQASDTARSINAKAFTLGKDLVFGSGEYRPGSTEGKRLMAHELTHLLQQTSTPSPERFLSTGLGLQRIPKNPEDTPFDAVVNHPYSVHIHAGPGENTKALADLKHGHPVTILGGRAWIHVKTEYEGQAMEGYISHELLDKVAPPKKEEAEPASPTPVETTTDNGTNTATDSATEKEQKKDPTALEKLDEELDSGWTWDTTVLSLLRELNPEEKQKVLEGYRDKLVSVLSDDNMFKALDILGADCDPRREWLKAEEVRLDYFTTGPNYRESTVDCSLDQDLKTRILALCECLVALRLVEATEFAATSACRKKKKAHRLSTAYHIINGYVSLSDLQAHLPSPGKAGDEVRDEDGLLWYVRDWTLEQAKAQAVMNWRGGKINLAYEGYAVGEKGRDPNTKDPNKPPVSQHVYGKAMDVWPPWKKKDEWDAAHNRVIKLYGLKRPIDSKNPYGSQAAEHWHFEKE